MGLVLAQPVLCDVWPEECECVVDVKVDFSFFALG